MMTKNNLCLVFIAFIATTGCIKRDAPLQAPLGEAKMVQTLVDVHLAEAQLTEYADKNQRDSLAQLFYAQALAINKVSAADFEKSMQEYSAHAYDMRRLYAQVEQELKRISELSPETAPPNKAEQDSILKVMKTITRPR